MDKNVLSLFDRTGNMVKPWAESGYNCICVDIEHDGKTIEKVGEGQIKYVEADINNYIPPLQEYEIVFAFPPCTNLAVSGARWFKDKGLSGLSEAVELVERSLDICEASEAPYMIENPVSTLSTYWRDPDYMFHPYEYDNYTDEDNAYSKKTCLWTNEKFIMPKTDGVEEYDQRMHQKISSSEIRSITPMGFANAVFGANADEENIEKIIF